MRIFVATLSLPEPTRNSGDKRFCALLGLLGRSHKVDLWLPELKFEAPYEGDQLSSRVTRIRSLLSGLGVTLLPPGWAGFARAMTLSHYCVGLFEKFDVGERMLASFRACQPGAAAVIDSVDVHFARELAGAELGLLDERRAIELRERELRVYAGADAVITVSEPDSAILNREGIRRTFLVPNIQSALHRRDMSRPPELLFVGGFRHPPNVDGILWFLDETWPLVCDQVPEATITIVGGDAPAEVVARHRPPSIDIVGHVPDTGPYLERAAVSVAPLRYGGGMKGKVSEALGAGMPIVTTSAGVSGFPVTAGVHLLVADEPAEFAAGVVSLLREPNRAARMGIAGQALLQSVCGPEAVATQLDRMLRELVPNPTSLSSRVRWMQVVAGRLLAKAKAIVKPPVTTTSGTSRR